jgi:hypothetical protein
VQLVPQLIPVGVLVTVPEPVRATVSAAVAVNVPLTVVFAFSVTTQGFAVPHPPPVHPLNTHPAAGVAVSVTPVPTV